MGKSSLVAEVAADSNAGAIMHDFSQLLLTDYDHSRELGASLVCIPIYAKVPAPSRASEGTEVM